MSEYRALLFSFSRVFMCQQFSVNAHGFQIISWASTLLLFMLLTLKNFNLGLNLRTLKYLFRLSEWSNEGKKEGVHIESEINQMADLISAVLLYSVSKTYQSISSASIMKTSARYNEQLEDDVISSCINLLAQNDTLLKQLLKKWINILGGRNIAIYSFYVFDAVFGSWSDRKSKH